MQVCYPTTPAQYFHLLRRQVKQEIVRPLIVMTPKSLLRLPAASSTVEDLTSGGFQPVINDAASVPIKPKSSALFCAAAKYFYDLEAGREDAHDNRVAIVRVEQFYPFPAEKLKEIFAEYENAAEIVWTQEEPKNMGGWTFVEPRLREIKRGKYVSAIHRQNGFGFTGDGKLCDSQSRTGKNR